MMQCTTHLHVSVPKAFVAIDRIELHEKQFPPGSYVLMSHETPVCSNCHCPWFDLSIPQSILAPDMVREAKNDLAKLPNLWIDSLDKPFSTDVTYFVNFCTQPRGIKYNRYFSLVPTNLPADVPGSFAPGPNKAPVQRETEFPFVPGSAVESPVKKLCMRTLKPQAFERLEVCVNTSFAPRRIALREGFPKGHRYFLMFQDTLICKSNEEREFDLPSNLKLSGWDLLQPLNRDLRNLEEGGLWIDCEPHAFICKRSNTGRFYFHRYGLEFFGEDGQSCTQTFYPHLTCKFDLGDLHTLSLQFSHKVNVLHWKSPQNVETMFDYTNTHQRTLLFWQPKQHKAKMDTLDEFVSACTVVHPQRLWVSVLNDEDMLPDDFACTQVYVE